MVRETPIMSGSPAAQAGADGGTRASAGMLIVNADDWGRDVLTTDRILQSCLHGAVTSVSAMVFMEDSERAAELARTHSVEAGLHLNFTTAYSAASVAPKLREHQERVGRFLLRHRLAQVLYHPGLAGSFRYLAEAQLEEFQRLYGKHAERVDGHHHMHLCGNVLLQRLLPAGTMVRRNFSFDRGEKSWGNRLYRHLMDQDLARRHWLTDYFFSLPPMEPARLRRIFALAQHSIVELETHPALAEELHYLTGGSFYADAGEVRIASPSAARSLARRAAPTR